MPGRKFALLAAISALFYVSLACAQNNPETRQTIATERSSGAYQEMNMPEGMKMPGDPVSLVLMRQASGTDANPASAPMEMITKQMHSWAVMFHGMAFVNDIQRNGPSR